MSGKDANSYLLLLRMAEVLMEACPQAVLGDLAKLIVGNLQELKILSNVNLCSDKVTWRATNVVLQRLFFAGIFRKIVEGPSDDPEIPIPIPEIPILDMIFDYGGIAFSILSITRRCVNWWMTRGPMEGPSPPFTHSLKAATFYFLPHMLFRSTALAFCCRFLGYNAIWPIAIIVIHTGVSFFFLHKKEENVRSKNGLFLSAILSLFAPLALFPDESSHRALMKRTILCKNIVFLFTLICLWGLGTEDWCSDTPLGTR